MQIIPALTLRPLSLSGHAGALPLAIALASVTGLNAQVTLDYDLLVQTGDTIPGSTATYTSLGRASVSQGNFAWRGSAAGNTGIFARINGIETTIARTGMPNGLGGTFSDGDFGFSLAKIDGDDVAFRAANTIYATFDASLSASPLELIASSSSINPNTGSPYSQAFQQVYISGGVLTFGSGSVGPAANTTMFTGGTLNASFDTADTLPSPMIGNTRLVGGSVYHDGILALQVFDSTLTQGIVTTRGGSYSMVSTGYENLPGQPFGAVQYLDPTIDGTSIGFIAWGPLGTGPGGIGSYRGVFLDDNSGSGLAVLAQTGDTLPDGGVFTDISRGPSLFGDTALFLAAVDGGGPLSGVYARFNGEIITVADTSTLLDGKAPASFNLSKQSLLAADQGTFHVTFTDGSQANYLFQIIHTPCEGDANGDLSINVADFIAVLLNFGSTGAGVAGDANGDNTVNVADFIAVLLHFGSAC